MSKRRRSKEDMYSNGFRYWFVLRIIILYPDLRSFIVVLLTAKIGFICHEAVTSLKLLEKGFSKEDLALSVLLDFPLQIFFGYYAAKWSNGPRPLKPVKCHVYLYINKYSNMRIWISCYFSHWLCKFFSGYGDSMAVFYFRQ